MLIEKIKKDTLLTKYLCETCSENEIAVSIANSIEKNDLLIIKVDDCYNKNVFNPPPSPDCLIIQKCFDNHYHIFIVELKNIQDQHSFKISNVKDKFITCLDDFMSNRFASYFHADEIKYECIKLLFITEPYGFKVNPDKQLKMKGHKLEYLLSQRIPKFFGKNLYIEHHIPTPTINNCKKVIS